MESFNTIILNTPSQIDLNNLEEQARNFLKEIPACVDNGNSGEQILYLVKNLKKYHPRAILSGLKAFGFEIQKTEDSFTISEKPITTQTIEKAIEGIRKDCAVIQLFNT